jgi:hypothetical protein
MHVHHSFTPLFPCGRVLVVESNGDILAVVATSALSNGVRLVSVTVVSR